MVEAEFMMISFKKNQAPDLDASCIETSRYLRPGQIFDFKCYDYDKKPTYFEFVDHMHIRWDKAFNGKWNSEWSADSVKKSSIFEQITHFLVFSHGCSIAYEDKIFMDKKGNEIVKFCLYIVCTFAIEWKLAHSIVEKRLTHLPKCEHKHPTFKGLCGEKDSRKFVEQISYFSANGAESEMVAKWEKLFQPPFDSIPYARDFVIFGKFFYYRWN